MTDTLTVCPACWTAYSAAGTCECDVDGIAPAESAATDTAAPAGTLTGDLLTLVRRATRVGWVDYDDTLTRTRDVITCDRPIPEDRVICWTCADNLGALLRAVPAVALELDISRTGAQGIDYRALGGTSGSTRPVTDDEDDPDAGKRPLWWAAPVMPLVTRPHIIVARDQLISGVHDVDPKAERDGLRDLVTRCLSLGIGTDQARPHRDRPTSLARWLQPVVDQMGASAGFAAAAYDLALLLERALHVVDRPVSRQQLGVHDGGGCGGRWSAIQGATFAWCDRCGQSRDAQTLRDAARLQLDDLLCTAAEIARLTTYLGLNAGRDQVRKRINTWHARHLITPVSVDPDTAAPRFRFADVEPLLLDLPSITNAQPTRPTEGA